MTNPNLSEVVLIVDMSSSMEPLTKETIANISKFIQEQKEVKGEANFSLIYFDNDYYVKEWRKNLRQVPNSYEYHVYGSTALRDALGKTIARMGQELRDMPEEQRPGHVIFCTITDGEENSSQEFSNTQIKSMIDVQRNVFNWTFIFMGSTRRSLVDAQSWGIPENLTLNYVPDSRGIEVAYASFSATTRGLRRGESKP